MFGRSVTVGVVVAAAGLAGCNCCKTGKPGESRTDRPGADGAARVVTVNSMCPIGGHEFDPAGRTAENIRGYKGTAIGFCCEDCSEHFDTLPEAEKEKVLARAKGNRGPE
jgi:YHS domain-containing protein